MLELTFSFKLQKVGDSNLQAEEGLKHEASSPELDPRDREKRSEINFIWEEEEEKEDTLRQDLQQDLLFAKEVANLPSMNRHSNLTKEDEEQLTYEALLQELSKIV